MDNASQVEIIINDFDGETGNDEMEIDNFEIVGNLADDLLLGDVNRDGQVNFLDISPFILALSSGEVLDEADIDENGVVNFLDIAPFINLLTGSSS